MWLIASIIGGIFVIGLLSEDPKSTKKGKSEKKTKNDNSLVINATKEMNTVFKYLTAHYLEYINYDEILNIPEADRLKVMQTVWKHWKYHGILKTLIKKYPDYDEEDLEVISQREMARCYTFYHWSEHKKNYGSTGVLIRIKLHSDWRTRFCDIEDEIKVFNYHVEEDNIFMNGIGFGEKLQTEYVYFWRNGDYIKFTPAEFKKFCKQNNYEYPFL